MNEKQTPIYSALAEDEDLREIVALFVSEMPERMARMQKAFTEQNWEDLRQAAHQFKGAAGSYGFMKLSPAAATLEETIKTEQPETTVGAALQKLIELCRLATSEPEPS